MINRRIYLVDTENCGQTFIPVIDATRKSDMVKLFYSVHSAKFDPSFISIFQKWESDVECIKMERGGKNQLDFQLSTYLGYLVKQYPKSNFIIISNDGGFASVIDFWKNRGYNVSVKLTNEKEKADDNTETKTFEQYLDTLIPNLDIHTVRRIKSLVFVSKDFISFKKAVKNTDIDRKSIGILLKRYRTLAKVLNHEDRKKKL